MLVGRTKVFLREESLTQLDAARCSAAGRRLLAALRGRLQRRRFAQTVRAVRAIQAFARQVSARAACRRLRAARMAAAAAEQAASQARACGRLQRWWRRRAAEQRRVAAPVALPASPWDERRPGAIFVDPAPDMALVAVAPLIHERRPRGLHERRADDAAANALRDCTLPKKDNLPSTDPSRQALWALTEVGETVKNVGHVPEQIGVGADRDSAAYSRLSFETDEAETQMGGPPAMSAPAAVSVAALVASPAPQAPASPEAPTRRGTLLTASIRINVGVSASRVGATRRSCVTPVRGVVRRPLSTCAHNSQAFCQAGRGEGASAGHDGAQTPMAAGRVWSSQGKGACLSAPRCCSRASPVILHRPAAVVTQPIASSLAASLAAAACVSPSREPAAARAVGEPPGVIGRAPQLATPALPAFGTLPLSLPRGALSPPVAGTTRAPCAVPGARAIAPSAPGSPWACQPRLIRSHVPPASAVRVLSPTPVPAAVTSAAAVAAAVGPVSAAAAAEARVASCATAHAWRNGGACRTRHTLGFVTPAPSRRPVFVRLSLSPVRRVAASTPCRAAVVA